MTGQCHQICQHHDNVPSLTTSPAPPVIRHKAGRYWALELETKVHGVFTITDKFPVPSSGLSYPYDLCVDQPIYMKVLVGVFKKF